MGFWIVAASVIGTFLFLFLFGYLCFRNACCRRKRYPADRRDFGGGAPLPPAGKAELDASRVWFDSQAFEGCSVTSADGLTLRGSLLAAEDTAKGTVIFFHGYHSSCRRDLSLQAMLLHRAGYHLILATQRSHKESEGTYICFGVKERLDVAPWCCLAARRFGELPIHLFGLSMGASTVMMAAGGELPATVRSVIADCGFSSPWEISRRTLWHKHRIPPVPTIYFMNFWSRWLADFDFRQISCEEALREGKLPVLLLHGEGDAYVPTQMSRDLADALPETVRLVTFPHALHGQSVYYDRERYEKTVLEFLAKVESAQ